MNIPMIVLIGINIGMGLVGAIATGWESIYLTNLLGWIVAMMIQLQLGAK